MCLHAGRGVSQARILGRACEGRVRGTARARPPTPPTELGPEFVQVALGWGNENETLKQQFCVHGARAACSARKCGCPHDAPCTTGPPGSSAATRADQVVLAIEASGLNAPERVPRGAAAPSCRRSVPAAPAAAAGTAARARGSCPGTRPCCPDRPARRRSRSGSGSAAHTSLAAAPRRSVRAGRAGRGQTPGAGRRWWR